MVRMFVRHSVADYDVWRSHYDDFDRPTVRGHAVYRSVNDANDVTVWHDFDDAEAAHAFAGSAELKEVMQKAGVTGAPTIWFTQEA